VAREKPQFAEITVNTESSSGPATLLALFIKNVKPDSITIGWRPPSDPYVEIQMYEVCRNLLVEYQAFATEDLNEDIVLHR
jgi:hypothetical protein